MDGQYGYDRSKTQSVGDLLGTDNATIGVMKNRSMEANTDTFVEPVFDEANSDGKVYILLPNSKGTLSPKKVYIRHLNKTEFDLAAQNNPIANDLKKAFNDLAGIVNLEKGFDEALDNVYMDLIELLYIPDSFHINIIADVSSSCDCRPNCQQPIVPNVGILASFHPVALDVASSDLVNEQIVIPGSKADKEGPGDIFTRTNPGTNWKVATEHAEKIGMGVSKYELIRI